MTLTVALADADPPGAVQLTVYVCVKVKFPVLRDPEVPVQPGGETVQDVVSEELQLIAEAVL